MDGLATLLARLPVAQAVRAELRARLDEPGRHYHGARHVELLWARHRRFGAGLPVASEPWDTLIACAIAFHDAIYDPRRRDNEAASAALWRRAGAALDAEGIDWVATTIEATADHLAARPAPAMTDAAWTARLWMLDLDLTPLGEAPDDFAANTGQLRREYAHLTEQEWESGRLGFLQSLAAAPRLFRTAPIAAAFEAPARANIRRELEAAAPPPGS